MSARTLSGIRGILFDRDGTLVTDVPFNADPELVVPMPTAAQAVALARRARLWVGVATNQPGLATGQLPSEAMWRVNARVEERLGRFHGWFVCPHAKGAGCGCRKPRSGLVAAASREWELRPQQLALIGDTEADVAAATGIGARGVLVPNARTRAAEIMRAPLVAPSLLQAVELVLAAGSAEIAS